MRSLKKKTTHETSRVIKKKRNPLKFAGKVISYIQFLLSYGVNVAYHRNKMTQLLLLAI